MNSKKVIGNSVVYTFNSILLKAFGFLLLPLYTNYLEDTDYGITGVITSFTNVANYIIAFCLFAAVMRFYADYKEDRQKVKRLFGSILMFVFLSGVVFTTILIVFHKITCQLFFKKIDFYPTVLIALVGLTFGCMNLIYEQILKSMEQAKKYAITSICLFFFQLVLNIIFIVFMDMGANGVLLATLIVNIAMFIYMLYDLTKNDLITICLDKSILREALIYSVPLLPHNLSSTIASFTSRIFIKDMVTLGSVGLFNIATQFGSITDMIQTAVNTAFQPYFYEQLNKKEKGYKENIVKLTNALVWVYGFLFIGLALFAQDLILLLLHKSYAKAWTVIPFIVVTFSIKILYYFYINILMYYKKATRYIFTATLSSSILNIVLSYLLIPHFDMYGSVMADIICMVIRVAIIILLSKKYECVGYKLRSFIIKILMIIGFICVGLIPAYTKYTYTFSGINFVYKLFIFMVYTGLCIYFMRDEIKKVYNKIKDKYIYKDMKNTYLKYGVKDKIIFDCNGGKSYAGNPKVISELLHKQCRRYEIVWLFKNPEEKSKIVPEYVRCVKIGTKQAYREMATARVWVFNGLVRQSVYKGRKQVYIQTWHGDRGFKKILLDLKKRKDIVESNICDLMLVGSTFGEKVCRSAFGYNGKVYKFGCPRNDILVNSSEEDVINIKSKLGIDKNTKVLLYAPTFRRKEKERELLDIDKVIHTLEEKEKTKWIALLRLHSESKDIGQYVKACGKGDSNTILQKVIDMTKYEDMSDLLLIADCLITDYSSCAGDFILRKKMLLLYQPDYDEYVNNEREGYFDIKDSPYLVGKNTEEICEIIKYFNRDKARINATAIMNFYGTVETGFSTKKVVEYINRLSYEDNEAENLIEDKNL